MIILLIIVISIGCIFVGFIIGVAYMSMFLNKRIANLMCNHVIDKITKTYNVTDEYQFGGNSTLN